MASDIGSDLQSSFSTAFFAYPQRPEELGACIQGAVLLSNKNNGILQIKTWQENDIAGRPLTHPIFESINDAQFCIADITYPNFNVTYEIGYSIGIGRRVILVVNKAFEDKQEAFQKIGIFDTLGYESYENETQLVEILGRQRDYRPLVPTAKLNMSSPIYVLQTPAMTSDMNVILSRVRKARLNVRTFDPGEESRMSAPKAIDDIYSSFGVIVPLIPTGYRHADVHNIRAAFVAGLAHGMHKVTLLLRPASASVPLDVRDFAKTFKDAEEISKHLHEFALDVTGALQSYPRLQTAKANFLADLSIGDPIAENEFQLLGQYYVRIDQFYRAERGDVGLVVGRKGSGKTALFLQLRDKKAQDKSNVVVDLQPEGYQLLKLKEEVLRYVSEGARLHLIQAFWEYLLYLEVCQKILVIDKDRHKRDSRLYDAYEKLSKLYNVEGLEEGDFSERLALLSARIGSSFRAQSGEIASAERSGLSRGSITELVYSHDIKKLKEALAEYLKFKSSTWVLFDNLDKGWSPNGLEPEDIMILQGLIAAGKSIQRDMRKLGIEFQTVLFIRNDVYQLLVIKSSDFGKEIRANLDWDDADLLREMVRRRLVQNDLSEEISFQDAWARTTITHFQGEETSQYFIDRSLMRPRNLLKIFAHCRSFAVNLSHERIQGDDIVKGLRSYSNDLITEVDQELRFIEPLAGDLIFQFIGEGREVKDSDFRALLELHGIPKEGVVRIVEFLLSYGFMGVRIPATGDAKYIFDCGYDLRILKAHMEKLSGPLIYLLNPALVPALNS